MRTLLCKSGNGTEFKVIIPDNTIVTFAPAIPPNSNDRFSGEREYALRIYKEPKKESNLLAVFTNIRSFRDVDQIEIQTLVVRERGKSLWKSDEKGYKVENTLQRESKFTDELNLLEGEVEEETDNEE